MFLTRSLFVVTAIVLLAQSVRAAEAPVSFTNDVLPVLSKIGCNQGTCHGSAAGKGGFALSLRGYAAELDYPAIVREAKGQRINRLDPDASLLLLKPTMQIPHQGGQVLRVGTPAYQILRNWIAQGAPGPVQNEPRPVAIEFAANALRLEMGESRPVVVNAKFSDGQMRDVTAWARFDSNDVTVAAVYGVGTIQAQSPGKAAVSAMYQDQLARIEIAVPFPESGPRDYAALPQANVIDELLIAQWRELRLWPSPPADDATFLRRAYLDVTGTLPPAEEVRRFLADADPQKRAALIDRLLASPEFVDMWTHKWEDIFRVSREWIGEKGVQAFHAYLRERIAANAPWDSVVRELVAGTGDGTATGPANFYRLQKVYNEGFLWPLTAAETTAQTFLGVRLQCARCHNHPLDRWTQADYYGMANLFAQVEAKDVGDQKLVMIVDQGTGDIVHPRLGRALPPKPPAGPEMPPGIQGGTIWSGASWVWDAPMAQIDAEGNVPRFFRKTFDLPQKAKAAHVYVTADDSYSLATNGQEIGKDSAWGSIERYDVAERLAAGKNVIALTATNGTGPGSAILWCEIALENGESVVFGTDASWKVTKNEVPADWTKADFDDTGWLAAVITGPANSPPWNLVPQRAPQLVQSPQSTRRAFLAAWITQSDNPFFARAMANRLWKHLMGRGLVEPVDDLRASNLPTNAPLLDALAAEYVNGGFDNRQLLRLILNSRAYQLSSRPDETNRHDHAFYTHYYPRRMTAEQIYDALGQVSGVREEFAGLPAGTRAQQLPDTKIPAPFLDTFGRPLRRIASCECERVQQPNLAQALELVQGGLLHTRVTADNGLVAKRLAAGVDDHGLIDEIYLAALARSPRDAEMSRWESAWKEFSATTPAAEQPRMRREFFEDLLWALVNSKEFLFNH